MRQIHRPGVAGEYEYTAVIASEPDGWTWRGHKRVVAGAHPRQEGLGGEVVSGGPYKLDTEAKAAADRWFESIPGILGRDKDQWTEDRRPEA